jgi:OmpA-OmpF porin, OOP family
MKKILVALLGAAFALPLAAQAEGAYVGINGGRAENKLSFEGESDKDHGDAYKLYGGYEFTKNFGVEAGYAHLAKWSESDVDGSVSYKPSSVYVAATGTLPLNDQFSLFAKAGVARNHASVRVSIAGLGSGSDSFNHTTAMFGVGAAYNFTKNFAVVAEYENFGKVLDEEGVTIKANMLSIGARYKF